MLLILVSTSLNAQRFTGQVVDSLTQKAVPFASVFLVDYHLGATCDAQGDFAFQGDFPEKVLVKVSCFGYETKFIQVGTATKAKIVLLKQHVQIQEVIVSGARNQLQEDNITYIEKRRISELNEIPTANLGQALEMIPGVYNSSTGNGISKPVIRGLQGTRVVSILNGVRIENQQWGGDHGMGLTDLGIETVEVIKGPASLLYGADALGGVIYFSDEAYAQQKSHELRVSSQLETNAMGAINSLFYKGSFKGLRINAGGRFNSQADFQTPEGSFVKNSRFQETAGKISLGWSKKKWVSHLKYSYATARVGIPGHTHDSVFSPDMFKSETQGRKKTLPVQYFTNHIVSFDNKFFFKKHTLEVLTAYTQNDLEEFEEKVTIPYLGIALKNTLYNARMKTNFGSNWTAIYGIQGMVQQQENTLSASDRLLPNAVQIDHGMYANLYYDLKRWKFQTGFRVDMRSLTSEMDTAHFPLAFSKRFYGYNYVIGGVFKHKKQLIRMNVSSGFRVPHLSELLSDGVHHGTLRYEIGNANLRPERAVQLDVSYTYTDDHLSVVFNPFVSQIRDYISINPLDSVIADVPVFRYQQIELAQLFGFDAGVHYHPHFAHFLHIESTFSYLRGLVSETQSLSMMPQPRWSNSIIARLNMKTKFKISDFVLQHQYYLPQQNVVEFEMTSSDYSVFNLGMNAKWEVKTPLQFQFGVRNLTNTRYINHLSRLKNIGLENPGRNIYIKLILTINYHEKK